MYTFEFVYVDGSNVSVENVESVKQANLSEIPSNADLSKTHFNLKSEFNLFTPNQAVCVSHHDLRAIYVTKEQ